jgi:hypothetical protein
LRERFGLFAQQTEKGALLIFFLGENDVVVTHLSTTGIIYELDLAGLRADGGQSGFEFREYA